MTDVKMKEEAICEICDKVKKNVREISGEGFVVDVCGECLGCEQE